MSVYYLKPVQIDNDITIQPNILEIGRKFGKVDVEVVSKGMIAAKALIMVQFLDR